MVNFELVENAVRKLAVGGQIFIQTDIEFLAAEMFELFRADDRLHEINIAENPFSIKTEREKSVEEKGVQVFRKKYVRV